MPRSALVLLPMTDLDAQPSPFDPLETAPPELSLEGAAEVAEIYFGVRGAASRLDSERDLNFRIDTSDGRRFLLKLSNPADPASVLDMQTQAMLHIGRQDPGLPVMQPLLSPAGDYAQVVEDGAGSSQLARLFTFLPGSIFEPAELDHAALHAFGVTVARMGVALRGFFHPAAGYKILWDLKHTPDLRRVVGGISEPGGTPLVERILSGFEERVGPALPGLRAQILHNDLTLDNVLLDQSHRVSGVVDFGDLTHTALVCDLAVTLVSMMWGRPDPLEAATSAISGYRSVTPIEPTEAAILADLVLARLAALVVVASWRVRHYPENAEYITANVELAWDLLRHLDDQGSAEVRTQLAGACLEPDGEASVAEKGETLPPIDTLLERRRRVLGPALAPLSYERPLYLVRGEGPRLFDQDGNAYLDAYNNVPVVGHCHPRVVTAIAEQSARLNTNTRYLHAHVVELAERLVATMPDGLDTVMFVNSGSEANDLAWRFATTFTKRGGAIVTSRAYHGVTTATLALSPEEWVTDPVHVARIPAPDGYRGIYRSDEEGWAERYAAHVHQAVASLGERGVEPAAFYVDSLFTSDGIFAPPPEYLTEVARRLGAAGCLLVADEVQSGFGRIGTHMWSFQASGVTPDFVTLGKPMGNGHPVAAVVTRAEIAERMAAETDVFSTFGGNPVACKAGLAVLDVVANEHLQQRALEVGDHLRRGLRKLQDEHSSLGDVRGAGLMTGVELVSDPGARAPAPELANAVMNRMRDKGVLVGSTGPDDNVLKIRPPLVVTIDDADQIVDTLDASLRELSSAVTEGSRP
jgi:4-aminobutyrate aminotransferase-like enzyme/Ser/Thr protein kinase RdoA (MazF antagonist)